MRPGEVLNWGRLVANMYLDKYCNRAFFQGRIKMMVTRCRPCRVSRSWRARVYPLLLIVTVEPYCMSFKHRFLLIYINLTFHI